MQENLAKRNSKISDRLIQEKSEQMNDEREREREKVTNETNKNSFVHSMAHLKSVTQFIFHSLNKLNSTKTKNNNNKKE